MVLLGGLVTIGAVLIAQSRLIHSRPERFRRERLRGGLVLALLFVGFALLHRFVAEAERPRPDPGLVVFDAAD